MTDNEATIRAGGRPPYVEVGMVLRSELGEVLRVSEIYRVNDGPVMAKLEELAPPPVLHVPCIELRTRWELARPWDEG